MNNVGMSDMAYIVSRTLENKIALAENNDQNTMLVTLDVLKEILALLKEQEAKHGEWIDIWREDDPDTSSHARCSVCNRISTRPVGAYCKWCGAKMDDEVEGR